MKKIVLCFGVLIVLNGCTSSQGDNKALPQKHGLITSNAMVVSARNEASQIGVQILKQGGNAFDAMMAIEMALAVTYPVAGNLGGGGFMVYRLENGDTGTLDYREKAPLQSTKTMYLNAKGNVIKHKSRYGAYAVAVPGTIAGIFEAQQKFGLLNPKEILQPVIELAQVDAGRNFFFLHLHVIDDRVALFPTLSALH